MRRKEQIKKYKALAFKTGGAYNVIPLGFPEAATLDDAAEIADERIEKAIEEFWATLLKGISQLNYVMTEAQFALQSQNLPPGTTIDIIEE